MRETSPYEGARDGLNGQMCFGKITSVDPDARTCRVKTLGRIGITDNQDLTNVKFLHQNWHSEGDEDISLPRAGAYVAIGFINSEPIVFGCIPLSNVMGGGGRVNQEALIPGDKTFATIGGNRITMRSGGAVQVESTKGCRIYLLPSQDLINMVCKNLEIEPAGGYINWTLDDDSDGTQFEFVAYDNIAVETAMSLNIGTTDNGAMLDMAIGTVDDNLDITTRNMQMQIQKDGTTTIQVGQGSVTINITPDGAVSIQNSGDTTINTSGDVSVQAGGDANVTAGGTAAVKASKITLNGESSGIITNNGSFGVVDFITGVPLNPSPTVFGDI